jgi:hypothetical protein
MEVDLFNLDHEFSYLKRASTMIGENVFSVSSFIEDNFVLLGYLSWQGAVSDVLEGVLKRGLVFCDCSPEGRPEVMGGYSGKAMFVESSQAITSLQQYGLDQTLIDTVQSSLDGYNPAEHIIVLVYTGDRMFPLVVQETDGMTPEECYRMVAPRASEFAVENSVSNG